MADDDAVVTAPGNLASLTLTITNLLDGANESLSAEVTGTSITAAYAAGVLTLSGTDTAAHYQQVLRSVRYQDVAANPDLTSRTITAVASDGSLSSSTATATLSMAINQAPVVSDFGKSVAEDNPLTFAAADFSAHFSDADAEDALQAVKITALPNHGSLKLSGTGVTVDQEVSAAQLINLTYQGDEEFNGSDSFAWNGSDGLAYAAAAAAVSLTVTPVNDPPSFTAGSNEAVDEDGGPQTVSGWATDISAGPSNESGQTLTFQVTGNDNPSLFAAGPAVDPGTGALTYTPAANASGSATIAVKLHDAGGTANNGQDASDEQEFTITVNAVNDAPVVSDFAKAVGEDSALTFTTADFTSHFSDADPGDSLQTVKLTALPSHGTLQLLGTSVSQYQEISSSSLANLIYMPSAGYLGSDSLAWNVSDGTAYAGQHATLTISVAAVNHAPSFTAGSDQTVDEDAGPQTVSGWATSISAGRVSESGQILTFQITGNSNTNLFAAGPAVDATNGTLTYTPAANAFGTATIQVQLHDDGGTANGGQDTSAVQTFTITVNAVNDAPVVGDFSKSVAEDGTLAIGTGDFTSHFGDADPGDSLQTVKITALPSHGSLQLSGTSVTQNQEISSASLANLTYVPSAEYSGSDSVAWNASDGTGYAGQDATLTITVEAVNHAPSFTAGSDQTVNEDAGPQTVSGWATNISAGRASESGQTLTFQITGNSNSNLFSAGPAVDAASGSLTYTPAANASGTATIQIQLHDDGGTANGGQDTSGAQTLTITVNPIDDAAAVSGFTRSVAEGGTLAFITGDFSDNFSDSQTENALQTVKILSLPGHGTLVLAGVAVTANQEISLAGLQTLTYQPEGTFVGEDSFLWNATAGAGYCAAPATVGLSVYQANQLPVRIAGTVADLTVSEDSGVTALGLTGVSYGPGGDTVEAGQTLSYQIAEIPSPRLGTIVLADGRTPVLVSRTYTLSEMRGLQFQTARDAVGVGTFSFAVTDDGTTNGQPDPRTLVESLTVTATELNDPPVRIAGKVAVLDVAPDQVAASLGLAGLAYLAGGGADETQQILTYRASAVPPTALGTVALADGTPVATETDYTLAQIRGLQFQRAVGVTTGTGLLQWTVTDDGTTAGSSDGRTLSETLTITVRPINEPPSANPQTVETAQETAADLTLTGDDGNAEIAQNLTFVILTAPRHGTLSGFDPATGEVTYTPATGYSGPDAFQFLVIDDAAASGPALMSAPAIVSLTVTPVNHAPEAQSQDVTLAEGTPVVLMLGDDGDPAVVQTLTLNLTAGPAHGTWQFDGTTGRLTYTPTASYHGSDSFTFTLTDDGTSPAELTSSAATVNLTITAVNGQPTAVAQTVGTDEDEPLVLTLVGDDGDPDQAQTLTFALVVRPLHGTLTGFDQATGEVTYSPNANFHGTDSFTYSVTDDGTAGGPARTSTPATVTITVATVNDPPTAEAAGPYTVSDADTIQLDASASSDVDQPVGTLTYLWDLDGDGVYGETGAGALRGEEVGVQPTFSTVGVDGPTSVTVSLHVVDSQGSVATDTAEINVINAEPVVEAGSSVTISTGTTFTRTASFTDGVSNGWTAWADYGDMTSLASVTVGTDKTLSLSHVYDQPGAYTVTVYVTDSDGASGSDSVRVTIGDGVPQLTVRSAESLGTSALPNGAAVNLGSTPLGTPKKFGFWITNDGGGELLIPPASLVVPAGFHLAAQLPETIAPHATAYFAVALDSGQAGVYSGTLSFGTNVPALGTFTLALSGQVSGATGPVTVPQFGLYRPMNPNSTYTMNPVLTGQVTGDLAGGHARVEFDHNSDHQAISGYVDVQATPESFLYNPREADPAFPQSGWVSVWYRLIQYNAADAVTATGNWTRFDYTLMSSPASSLTVSNFRLGHDTGPSSSDRISSEVTLTGDVNTGSSGSNPVLVQIEVGGAVNGTAAVSGGRFEIVPTNLAYGALTNVRARVVEWSGEQGMSLYGPWTSLITVTWQEDRPQAITELALATAAPGDVTADPGLAGRLAGSEGLANVRVNFYASGADVVPMGWTWTDAEGRFEYQPKGLTPGPVVLWARTSRTDSMTQQEVYGEWKSLSFTYLPAPLPAITQLNLLADTGEDPDDNVTTDPTLIGRLIGPGTTSFAVLEFDSNGDGQVDDTARTDSDGNFRFTPTGLAPGQVTLRARVRQRDENQSADSVGPWTALSFTLQAAPAPAAASVTGLALVEDTGPETSDNITSNPTLTGQITAMPSPAYLLVQVDQNNDGLADGSVETDRDGNFTYQLQDLADGPVTVGVRVREWQYSARQYVWTAWQPFSFTYQANVNQPPEVNELKLQSDTQTSGDGLTGNPLLVGQVSDDDSAARLTVELDHNGDGLAEGVAFTDAQGRFRYRPEPLGFGPVTVRARALQWDSMVLAFVVGEWVSLSFVYEDQPLAAPVLSGLGLARDTGTNGSDGITSDPTISGYVTSHGAPQDVSVEFQFDTGGPAAQAAQADGYGRFSYQLQGLSDGEVTVHVRAVTIAPQSGQVLVGAWQDFTFTQAAAANAPPVVAQLQLNNDTGVANDSLTTDPTLRGQVTDDNSAGSLVVEFDHDNDGVIDGSTVTDEDGHFTYAPAGSAIQAGELTIRARAKESFRGASAAPQYSEWATVTFTLQEAPSSLPQVSDMALMTDSGAPGDGVTNVPNVSGHVTGSGGVAGVSVQFDTNGDGAPDATVAAAANGSFSYSPQDLAEGQVVISARTVTAGAGGSQFGDWKPVQFVFYASVLTEAEATALASAVSAHRTAYENAQNAYSQTLDAADVIRRQLLQSAVGTYEASLASASAQRQAAEAAAAAGQNGSLADAQAAFHAAMTAAAAALVTSLAAFAGDPTSYPLRGFALPEPPPGNGFKVPDDARQSQPNVPVPSYTGFTYQFDADSAYGDQIQAAEDAYRDVIEAADEALKSAREDARDAFDAERAQAQDGYAQAASAAYQAYRTAVANLGNDTFAQDALQAALARNLKIGTDYAAEVAQHKADFDAQVLAAHAVAAAANTSAAWYSYFSFLLSATHAWYDLDAQSSLLAALALSASDRQFQDSVAEHEPLWKHAKLEAERVYKGALATAEENRVKALAEAKRKYDFTVAEAVEARTLAVAEAESQLRQDRVDAAQSAISVWADATETPWSDYQQQLIDLRVAYVTAANVAQMALATTAAAAVRSEAETQAKAEKARLVEIAHQEQARTAAKGSAQKDYFSETLDAGRDRIKADALVWESYQNHNATAQYVFTVTMAAAHESYGNYFSIYNRVHLEAIQVLDAILSTNPSPAVAQAATDAYMDKCFWADYQFAQAEIEAMKVRNMVQNAAQRALETGFHGDEHAYLDAVAVAGATHDQTLAQADRDWSVGTASASGVEQNADATAWAQRVKAVADAEQTAADTLSSLAVKYDVDNTEALRDFRVDTAADYVTALTAWKAAHPTRWAEYLVDLAGDDEARITSQGAADVDYATRIGNAVLTQDYTDHAADRTQIYAYADAEQTRVADEVAAQDDFAVAVGDARQDHAGGVADATAGHDSAVAGDNKTYQDSLSVATETRKNAVDAAEWQAERATALLRYVANLARSSVPQASLDAIAATRRQQTANACEAYANTVATARLQWTQDTGDDRVQYLDDLRNAAATLAAWVRASTADLAWAQATARKTRDGAENAADRTWGDAYADASQTFDGDAASADARLALEQEQTDDEFREATVADRGDYASSLYVQNETAMAAVAAAAGTSLAAFQAAAATQERIWTQAFAANWILWEDDLTAAYLDRTIQQNATDLAYSSATSAANNAYTHTIGAADEAEANGIDQALEDQTAREREAAARKTEEELIAQAQYDLDKAEAHRDFRNAVAAADASWTATVAAHRAHCYVLISCPPSDVERQAQAQRDIAKAQAEVAFVADVGDARIDLAEALGQVRVDYATRMGDAEITATSEINTAEAARTEAYGNADKVLAGLLSIADSSWSLVTDMADEDEGLALKLANVDWFTDLGADNETLSENLADATMTFHTAQAMANASDWQARALLTGAPLDVFRADEAVAFVTWLDKIDGVCPNRLKSCYVHFVSERTDAGGTRDIAIAVAEGDQAIRDSQADEVYDATVAPLDYAYAVDTAQKQADFNNGATARDNTWYTNTALADKTRGVAKAQAEKRYLIDLATAETTYRVAMADVNLVYWQSTAPSPPLDVTALLLSMTTAAESQKTFDAAFAKVSFVTADADADLVSAKSKADNDKTWATDEADAVKSLRFDLAALDKTYAVGLSVAGAMWDLGLAASQIQLWDDFREAEAARNTADGELWSEFRSVQNAAGDEAITALDTAQNLPWTEFLDDLAGTVVSWWTRTQAQYTAWFSGANADYDTYQKQIDAGYLVLSVSRVAADVTWDLTQAAAGKSHEERLATIEHGFADALTGPTWDYVVDTAQAKHDYEIALELQAVSWGTADAAAYQAKLTAAEDAYAAAEVLAQADERLDRAEADRQYAQQSTAADVLEVSQRQAALVFYVQTSSADYQTLQNDLADGERDYFEDEATSFDAAVDALSALTSVPWADAAAAASQAWADLVTAIEEAMVTQTAGGLAAWKAQQISRAVAEQTKANADAAAEAAQTVAAAQAALDRAEDQTLAELDLLASGQYVPDLPEEPVDWFSGSAVLAMAEEDHPGEFSSSSDDRSAYCGAVDSMFIGPNAGDGFPTMGWGLAPLYAFSLPSPNVLREYLLRPMPPEVARGPAFTAAPLVAAQVAAGLSATAHLTDPSPDPTPLPNASGGQTSPTGTPPAQVILEVAVAQFQRLMKSSPEVAAELEKTIWWLDAPQDDSASGGALAPGVSVPDGDGAPTGLETQLGATWEDHTLVQTQQTLTAVSQTDYSGRARLMEPVAATPPRDTQLDCENTAASGPLDRTGAIVPDFWYSYIEPPVPSGGVESNADGTASGPDATSATGSSAGSSTAHANVPRAGLPAALAQAAAGLPSVSIKGGLAAQISGLGTATSVSGLFGSVSLWPGHNDLAATLPASLGSIARPDLQLQAALGQLPGISLGSTSGAADPAALIGTRSVSEGTLTRSASEWATPQTTRPRPADPTGFPDAGTGLAAANWTFVASYQSEGNHVVQLAQPDPDGAGPAEAPLTELSYDAQGNLVQVTLPDSSTRHWTYDATSGQLTGQTDELGHQTLYTYDEASGQVATVRQVVGEPDTTANGQTDDLLTTYTYTQASADPDDPPSGLISTMTDPLGHVTQYDYNARGLVTQITFAVNTADQASVTYQYDSASRLIAETDELGRRLEYTYDRLGRMIRRTDPDPDGLGPLSSPVTTYEYDPLGQVIRETDPVGRVTGYTYQSGQVVQVTRPNPAGVGAPTVTTLTYTAAGQLASVTDPLGHTTAYVYDSLGRQIETVQPDPDGTGPLAAPVSQVAYDGLGRVTEQTDALGNVTHYAYANYGRNVTVTAPDPDGAGPLSAPVTAYAYDAAGNLLSATDALDRVTAFAYDELGRTISQTGPYLASEGPEDAPTSQYAYDKAGNVVSVTDPSGNTTHYVYDARSRRVEATLPDPDGSGPLSSPVLHWTYDAAGQLISQTDAQGNVTTYQYDGLGRKVRETAPDPDATGPRLNGTRLSVEGLPFFRPGFGHI